MGGRRGRRPRPASGAGDGLAWPRSYNCRASARPDQSLGTAHAGWPGSVGVPDGRGPTDMTATAQAVTGPGCQQPRYAGASASHCGGATKVTMDTRRSRSARRWAPVRRADASPQAVWRRRLGGVGQLLPTGLRTRVRDTSRCLEVSDRLTLYISPVGRLLGADASRVVIPHARPNSLQKTPCVKSCGVER